MGVLLVNKRWVQWTYRLVGCYTRGTKAKWFQGKKEQITQELKERLEGVQVEHTDALKILKLRDVENESFHYVDPPYIGSDCGHYGNYNEEDFRNLLSTLSGLKGNFFSQVIPLKYSNNTLQSVVGTPKKFR